MGIPNKGSLFGGMLKGIVVIIITIINTVGKGIPDGKWQVQRPDIGIVSDVFHIVDIAGSNDVDGSVGKAAGRSRRCQSH